MSNEATTVEELEGSEEPTTQEQLDKALAENASYKLEIANMKKAYWELHSQYSAMQAQTAAQELQALTPGQAPATPG